MRNLFADVPRQLPAEVFEPLVRASNVRIERIVSTGQASPPGDWYDQPWDEWVAVLAGSAAVQVDGEGQPRVLAAGDFLHLPARLRHRVEWTSSTEPTVWLAVHFRGEAPADRLWSSDYDPAPPTPGSSGP